MPEIVFVTMLIGLLAGPQPVEVRVGPDVKSVRIMLGAEEIATLTQPPWRTTIDFGIDLEPEKLEAIAYDAKGRELGRATQLLNLPRSVAEVAIVVDKGKVDLRARHLEQAPADAVKIELDGKPLRVENMTARLPAMDAKQSHVIAAEVRFHDGTVVRREMVLTGGVSYSAEAELTPVLVTGQPKENINDCFSAAGVALHATAIERSNALVIMVKDPSVALAKRLSRLYGSWTDAFSRHELAKLTRLPEDTALRILWPIGQLFGEHTEQPAMTYRASHDLAGAVVPDALGLAVPGRDAQIAPRTYADAVAVAGVRSLDTGKRRAVVLVASAAADRSEHTPASVRRYLERIGVPLVVWSADGPHPEWGEVADISSVARLHEAIASLNATLDAQSIVWLPVDPLTALHVQVKPECGVTMAAH